MFHHKCEGAVANTWLERHSSRDTSFLWRRHGEKDLLMHSVTLTTICGPLTTRQPTIYASTHCSPHILFHTPHHTPSLPPPSFSSTVLLLSSFSSTVLLLFHRPPSPVPRRNLTHSISLIFRLTILPIARHVPHPVPPVLSGEGGLVFYVFPLISAGTDNRQYGL